MLVRSQNGLSFPENEASMKKKRECGMRLVFLLAACTCVLAVALICIFLFANGIPAMNKIGFWEFISGRKWKPAAGIYGIFPMILGSICVTVLATAMGVPVSIFAAIFLTHYCSKKLYPTFKAAVDLMAGIPSVVYGFFGLVLIVPVLSGITGKDGSTMFAASVLLAIMILPTVTGVAEAALRSVPNTYYEGALALGATKEQSIFRVLVPSAKSGIAAAAVLGIGRAVGETMAVIMVAGNQARMPKGINEGIRTLTANIVMEMGYAADLHREALIATGVVLFVLILIINISVSALNRRS